MPARSPLTFYILRDRKALPTRDMMKWGRMLEDSKARTVASTLLENVQPWIERDRQRQIDDEARRIDLGFAPRDVLQMRWHPTRIHISTVFLGLNHRWGNGPPLLFETMIFNGPLNEYQQRYTTWEEAESGHLSAVEETQRALVAPVGLVSNDLPGENGG